MKNKPQLSSREKRILIIYALSAVGVIGIYLLLGFIQRGTQIPPSLHKAEIAVLVPLKGAGAENGKKLLDAVTKSKEHFVDKLNLANWEITVRGYDTGKTANSAAWAAYMAARNPNTVAIIGPLNATQVVAVEDTVRGENLPIITPASTAPILNVSSSRGVYRIPATDDRQGFAIVSFLANRKLTNVFLLVESNSYTATILDPLKAAAKDRIRFVGSSYIESTNLDSKLFQNILDSKASAIIYLGNGNGLSPIIKGLKGKNLKLPIVGVDSINDPKLAGLLSGGQELFFTSPIYIANGLTGDYLDLFFNETLSPYSLESTEATWLILEALSKNSDGLARESVWANLPNVTIRGISGAGLRFIDGQLTPTFIYIYKGSAQEATWFKRPEAVFNSQ